MKCAPNNSLVLLGTNFKVQKLQQNSHLGQSTTLIDYKDKARICTMLLCLTNLNKYLTSSVSVSSSTSGIGWSFPGLKGSTGESLPGSNGGNGWLLSVVADGNG